MYTGVFGTAGPRAYAGGLRRKGRAGGQRKWRCVLILLGDVHHGYLAEADFRDARPVSRVYQAVCSPLRNALPGKKSRLQSAALAGRVLSRLAGVGPGDLTWRLTHGAPFFGNQVATLELDGLRASITSEKANLDASGEPALQKLYGRRLA